MKNTESFTDQHNERQAKIKRIKLLGISQRGLERVVTTARTSNKAREDERTGAILEAASNAKQPELDSNE